MKNRPTNPMRSFVTPTPRFSMTFLQPFILWGLPLALLPIIIHLLNRMRYRTQRWAAMSFLFSANRASTRYAKLRQWLILACRVLALLMLIFAIARPLAGGWLGWALSPSPDVVLVLLDHSASMEAHDTGGTDSRREQALRAIAGAAAPFADRSRFVLLENAVRKPQEIEKADFETLSGLALTGPTDTGADMPAMLDAATEWLSHNQAGVTEIWIASDLQRTNWQPDSNRWPAIMARLASLRQTVRVRLLAMTQPAAPDISVAITDMHRRDRAGQPELDLTLDLERADSTPVTLPVSLTLDDVRSNFDATLQGQSLRLHRALTLDPERQSGWGKIELPPDGNLRDNTAYFVYGPPLLLRIALVAADDTERALPALRRGPLETGVRSHHRRRRRHGLEQVRDGRMAGADARREGRQAIAGLCRRRRRGDFFPARRARHQFLRGNGLGRGGGCGARAAFRRCPLG